MIVRWVGFVLGLALVGATALSVVRSLLLPRGEASHFATFVGRRIVWRGFLFVANRFADYERKDRILAIAAPVSLPILLLSWMAALLLGFALMLWPLTEGSFATALREAGSSMTTLGFASGDSAGAIAIDVTAAATGLIVIALLIAYLPTMYSSFNRRENLVTMLQSRAGAPAWGPEILARSAMVPRLGEELPQFYAHWEEWAADVAESHATYPALIWFRSPHPLRSWIVALLAVLDSAALYHSLCPSSAPPHARLCLRMGFTCLRHVAEVANVPFDPDPYPDDPIELTYEEYMGGIHRLEQSGFVIERTPEEAWEHFRGWRVNYESIAYALANLVVAPPGPWTGSRHHLPGIAIVPQRPADRQAGDPAAKQEPKSTRFGWRA